MLGKIIMLEGELINIYGVNRGTLGLSGQA
jgi:hypothetical protein